MTETKQAGEELSSPAEDKLLADILRDMLKAGPGQHVALELQHDTEHPYFLDMAVIYGLTRAQAKIISEVMWR